jgi:hypothetical protein
MEVEGVGEGGGGGGGGAAAREGRVVVEMGRSEEVERHGWLAGC